MLVKSIVLLLAVSAVIAKDSSEEYCKLYVDQQCNKDSTITATKPCTPIYGAINNNKELLRTYIKEHIGNSFEYLLQWSNFNNYKKDREGFAKLYRKLSDDTWEDSIKLIQYLGKRGVELDFAEMINKPVYAGTEGQKYGVPPVDVTSDTEFASLAKVLDLHKHLAISGNKLHEHSLKREKLVGNVNHEHDIELAHFIEEEFAGKHAQTVRDLAGHSNDLYRLLKEGGRTATAGMKDSDIDSRGLYIHLFDEHLRKLY